MKKVREASSMYLKIDAVKENLFIILYPKHAHSETALSNGKLNRKILGN